MRCVALRPHAQLARAVDCLAGPRHLDHALRHHAQALPGAHGQAAQQLKRFVLGDPARAHQHACGAVPPFARFEALRQTAEFAFQQWLVPKSRPRHLDDRQQPVLGMAIDPIGVDAGVAGALDLLRIAVRREHDERARRQRVQQARRLDQHCRRADRGGHHEVGAVLHHEVGSVPHRGAGQAGRVIGFGNHIDASVQQAFAQAVGRQRCLGGHQGSVPGAISKAATGAGRAVQKKGAAGFGAWAHHADAPAAGAGAARGQWNLLRHCGVVPGCLAKPRCVATGRCLGAGNFDAMARRLLIVR